MPSWAALPLEVKHLIFDHVLRTIVHIKYKDIEEHRECILTFTKIYPSFLQHSSTFLGLSSGDAFLRYLRIYNNKSTRLLEQCLATAGATAWETIKNVLTVAPELEKHVRETLEKEFKKMSASFREDCTGFPPWMSFPLQSIFVAHDNAVEGIRKEVMKHLCWQMLSTTRRVERRAGDARTAD